MKKFIIGSAISIIIATLYSSIVGHSSKTFNGIPQFYLLALGIHLIQIIAFVPAKIFNTQKFYDLTGSITFILSTIFCLSSCNKITDKQVVASLLLLVWTIRLGGFLFYRIIRLGQDSRFVTIKLEKMRFFMSWILQGLWVTITGSPVFVYLLRDGNYEGQEFKKSPIQIIGVIIWVLGMVVEIVADTQKFMFTLNKDNQGKFIRDGIWKYSRHPNYCGEILVWFGIGIFLVQSLKGWQLVSLISPIFVYFLLTKVSGLPLLEAKGEKKWGKSIEYQEYKKNTPILFPFSKERKNEKKEKGL